jgi:peroxiredoxin
VATAYGVVNDARPVAMRWTFYIGPDGRILAIDTKVSPGSAGEDIVKKLEELKVPKRKT